MPELADLLKNGSLSAVQQAVLPWETGKPRALLFRFTGEKGGLFISLDRENPALFWTRKIGGRKVRRGLAHAFDLHLAGTRVLDLRQPRLDRLVTLESERFSGRMKLHLEMTGRLTNLVLTRMDGAILCVARPVSGKMSRVRKLEVGSSYRPPPRAKGQELGVGAVDRWELLAENPCDASGLARFFSPISPWTARTWGELFQRGGWSVADGLREVLRRGEEPGRLVPFPTGKKEFLTAVPETLLSQKAESGLPRSFSEAAEEVYLRREKVLALARQRGEIEGAIRREIKKIARLEERLREQMLAGAEAPFVRRQAELLAANLHRSRRGQDRLVCTAFDGSGDVTIKLDPALKPAGNLDRLFARARRLEQIRVGSRRHFEKVSRRRAELETARAGLEVAGDLEAISAAIGKVRSKEAGWTAASQRRIPAGVAAYRSTDGLEILVGRHAKGNHLLTFKLAKAKDLWFHARDYPGSHVVLRRQGRKEPPPRAILEAAALAAVHSKAAADRTVQVAYCHRHQVRAIRGGPAGRVTFSGEKNIAVRMEPDWIETLLARRMA